MRPAFQQGNAKLLMLSIVPSDILSRMIDAAHPRPDPHFRCPPWTTGSFSAAARKLGRVQSAISQSIAGAGVAARRKRCSTGGQDAAADRRRAPPWIKDAPPPPRTGGTSSPRAATIASGVEPELSLAVDPIFPHEPLMASLKGAEPGVSQSAGHDLHRGPWGLGAAAARRRCAIRDLRRCRWPASATSRPNFLPLST